MPSQYETNMEQIGRYGGDKPNCFDTDKGREAYARGQEQRQIDRASDEALQKLIRGYTPGK